MAYKPLAGSIQVVETPARGRSETSVVLRPVGALMESFDSSFYIICLCLRFGCKFASVNVLVSRYLGREHWAWFLTGVIFQCCICVDCINGLLRKSKLNQGLETRQLRLHKGQAFS